MDWINDVYKQGTLENKLAKKIWFLDSSRLFYLLEKDLGKQIPKEFIETHRDEITKHFMNGNVESLAEELDIKIGNLTK